MIHGGNMNDNEHIALGNGSSKFIVDIHLPDHKGDTIKLRTYYDPLTCEIQHGCTYFTVDGVWQLSTSPDWALWQEKVWRQIMRSRQSAVCISMNHSPEECPNETHKEEEEYNHPFYEHDE